LSYSGQDINLDYMIKHVSQKIVAGIAPDFLMGVGDQASKANAQIRLISYILAIYSKRKLFLKPLEECLLKPFLKKYGLKKAWLEFGELDFETKNEKVNRIGSMWTQNLITFNEARQELGLDTKPENGDSFYLEWQNSMMDTGMGDGGGFNFPTAAPQGAGSLPNGESPDKVFDHNSAPNRKPPIEGGKMPFDPYQKKTDVPKFLQKGDIQKPGESYSTKDMPESYDLNSSEATITIDIPDGIEAKTKQITF